MGRDRKGVGVFTGITKGTPLFYEQFRLVVVESQHTPSKGGLAWPFAPL